ncbi:hypothetical protein KIN20_006346 [Parelaphostrongylus tenuis]|uniref:Protein kinase domain-containing protein n=1 Tax=Parelaphostrongylus tenuis TaxID=148309 RepID=A0AAD5MK23_PARTN|nr:hypothetical protein KIN20_006346 [Parelaphostrongylus tenuis]
MLPYTPLELQDVATIGYGSFGQVNLAWSNVKQQYYAVKTCNIHQVIQEGRVEYVKREKQLLFSVSFPFIVRLICTHMDRFSLYFVMEFVHGGELMNYLDDIEGENLSDTARFYAMEIICALEYIHSKSIVYRDLKPENLLLSIDGHVKLSDFGLAKLLKAKTYTVCGTMEYMAPEIIMKKGYGLEVDWWSLGILIFELFTGNPPFYGDKEQIYSAICNVSVDIPESVPDVVRIVIQSLLNRDPSQRAHNISEQKWFENIDWEKVKRLTLQPPIIPAEFDMKEMPPVAKDTNAEESMQRERDLFADWDEFCPCEARTT